MDRYPSPLESTRDTMSRRIAEWVAAAGIGGVFTLALAAEKVNPIAWWLTVGPTVVAAAMIACDELRLRRLDNRAWTTDQWDLLRENEYRRRQGIFLTHSVTAALGNGEDDRDWWAVTVQLAQHRKGPLSDDQIKEVEYSFGPKFTEGPVKAQSREESFSYKTTLHGPLLVLARVVFKNRFKRPLLVERYIDLPGEKDATASSTG